MATTPPAIPAGFVLSESAGSDGLVFAATIEGMAWAPVVLLSVCGAARGPERIGDAAASDLRGAFLRGGVRCLVVSSANVNRLVTHALMVRVTEELAQGCSVAEALRRGREQVWSEAATSDPYFHSMIQAFGPPSTGRVLVEGGPRVWWWVLAGAALVAASVAYNGLRRSRRKPG